MTDAPLAVSTRSAHLPGWLPAVFGSVSPLYCSVVLSRWFGLRLLISASPAALPSALMVACLTFAVATHEPEGTSCRSICALPVVVYRSPRSIGIVRWPPATVGGVAGDGVDDLPLRIDARAGELIRQRGAAAAAQSSPAVCGSDELTTLNASNVTLSSPEPSCLPNTPTRRPPGPDRYSRHGDRRAERRERRAVGRAPGGDRLGRVVVDEADPDVVAGQREAARVGPRHRRRRQGDRALLSEVSTRSAHLPGWLPDVFGSVSPLYWIVVLSRWFGFWRLISARPAGFTVGVDVGVGDLGRRDPRARRHGLQHGLGGALVLVRGRRCSSGIVRRPLPTVGRVAGGRVDDLPLRIQGRAVELIRLRRQEPPPLGESIANVTEPTGSETLPALSRARYSTVCVPVPLTVNLVTNGSALPVLSAAGPRAAVDAVLDPLDAGARRRRRSRAAVTSTGAV